jgi:allantoin racemase
VKIVVINPNTTESMTQAIGVTATAVASAGTTIIATQPVDGPVSIEGFYDEAFAVPGVLEEIRRCERWDTPPDAYVIACFDDTGLDAARCVTAAPVIGIGEAGCHLASLLAPRFAIVTTLARAIVALGHNVKKYGFGERCVRIRAAEVPVLALEEPGSDARQMIDREIAAALRDDGAEAIVLGCAGMTALTRSLSEAHGVPVIDGVAAAVKLAESLVGLGLRTSKINSYAAPLSKTYKGRYAGIVAP